ncbi:MAG: hypothetical protein Q7S79_03250 [bacterium]|nr:hypothetical protein [bacterium]
MQEHLKSPQAREPLPSEKLLSKPLEDAPSIQEALRNCERRLNVELAELKRRLPTTDSELPISLQ